MKVFLATLTLLSVCSITALGQKADKRKKVEIQTKYGKMVVELYNETPLHRDNFIKLVNEKYYDDLIFHRVIKDFMVQGGDPNSRNAAPNVQLGSSGPGYTIPAEILPQFKHKKGALAAARLGDQMNPKKESSGSQFYIVHNDRGTPHLDGEYTIFGEVISGFDVIDKIATQPVRQGDNRPTENITMKIRIIE